MYMYSDSTKDVYTSLLWYAIYRVFLFLNTVVTHLTFTQPCTRKQSTIVHIVHVPVHALVQEAAICLLYTSDAADE